MRGLGGVILGEGLHLALSALAALAGQEAQRAVAGVLELQGGRFKGGPAGEADCQENLLLQVELGRPPAAAAVVAASHPPRRGC